MSDTQMADSVKYLLLKIAADAANEGRKTYGIKDVENINAAIAYKVLKQHNINPKAEWMFQDANYLNDFDDGFYQMVEISSAMIKAQKQTIKDLKLEYGLKGTDSDLVHRMIKAALTIYMFNATNLLKERK